MGTRGDRQSAAGARLAESLVPRLEPLGSVSARKMFGGYGLFQEGKMFGLITSGAELFLKAGPTNQALFRRARSPQHGKMPYFRVPKSVLGDDDRLADWAGSAVEVAHS